MISESCDKNGHNPCKVDNHISCEVKVKVTQSSLTLRLHGLYSSWNSPGLNTGVGSLSLFQGIFPTQESKPDLLRCRQILYQLSHKGGIYTYNEMLFSHKKEGNSAICDNMDGPHEQYNEIHQNER